MDAAVRTFEFVRKVDAAQVFLAAERVAALERLVTHALQSSAILTLRAYGLVA